MSTRDDKLGDGLAETLASDPSAQPTLPAPAAPALAETVGDPGGAASAAAEVERVDRYVIKRRLGAGGMGVVYEASDPELGRDVAIKMLRRGASASRLRREAQALAKLDHPNVVSVYDVGEHDGQVFVAMALVDGSNLRDWLAQDHTTDEVLHVVLAAARGIIAAHDAGLVHRDLKPDNIFIAKDGGVQVGDFGLATDLSDDEPIASEGRPVAAMSLTQTGHVLGTPAYMAPEQAAGDASERSDQFSFCVTAYEALFGTRPFLGQSFDEILDRVESGSIAQPVRARRVPRRVAEAIRRGLSADPEARFASMKELVAAMTVAPRRRRWPWLAGVAGVAVLGVGAVVLLQEEPPDPVATCAPHRRDLDDVWGPQARGTLVEALTKRATRGAAEEVATRFDTYAARWLDARVNACTDEVHGTVPANELEARVACLELNRMRFQLAIGAVDANVEEALTVAMIAVALPAIEACEADDAARLVVLDEGHADLMRTVETQLYGGDLGVFADLRARAEQQKDRPAQLEIAFAEARRAVEVSQYDVAEAALQRALALAETLEASGARARALSLFADSRCKQNKDPESYLAMAEIATGKLERAKHPVEHVDLLQARARCAYQRDRLSSIPLYEELFRYELERYGAESAKLVDRRSQLALLYRLAGRGADAQPHEAEVDRLFTKYLGDRPAAAERTLREAHDAFVRGDVDRAIELQRRGSDLLAGIAGAEAAHAEALRSLAMFYEVRVEWRLADEAHGEVLAAFDRLPVTPETTSRRAEAHAFRGWTRLNLDEVQAAVPDFERARSLAKPSETETLAIAQLGTGRAWVALGEPQRALAFLREGLVTHAKLGAEVSKFRVGVAELALAKALWSLGQKEEAREMAKRAETSVALGIEQSRETPLGRFGLPSRQAQLDELVRWRDQHR